MKAFDSSIHTVSRRTFLRSAGSSLLLPFLPSLAWATGQPDPQRAPRRFVSMVCGDGMHPSGWWAKSRAAGGLELGPTLQPLASFANKMAYIGNLNHKRKMARVHGYGFTTFLTCTYAPSGQIRADISIDQLLARTYGKDTLIPSLVFGVEPLRPGIVNGAPSIYQATCSWSTPTTPVSPEVNPRQAFDRLFDTSSLKADRSVLDFVLGSANRVKKNLSTDDRDKMDQYFTSVREIEKRIDAAEKGPEPGEWQPTLEQPNISRPTGTPGNPREHMKLMLDIAALALQMDKTRVANFVLAQDFSSKNYQFLDGVGSNTAHNISHHQNKGPRIEEYKRVNQYLVEEVAYFINRLDSVQEGHGKSLLDNTVVFFGSCMMDGNTHTREELPIVLIGGESSGLNHGFYDYTKAGAQSLGRLHVSIAQNMGLDINRVGDQEQPLTGLFRG